MIYEYYHKVEELKRFISENEHYFYNVTIMNNTLDRLDLDMVLYNLDFKDTINMYLSNLGYSYKVNYFTETSMKEHLLSDLPKEYVFDKIVNTFSIYGKPFTNNYLAYLKTKYANETIEFKGKTLSINDLVFLVRGSAGGLVYNTDTKKFLLIKANMPNEDYWTVPKGGIEEGESQISALGRELFEETGLKKDIDYVVDYTKTNILQHSYVRVNKSNISELVKAYTYIYLVKTTKQDITLSDEHLDYKWLDKDQAIQQISYPQNKFMLTLLSMNL